MILFLSGVVAFFGSAIFDGLILHTLADHYDPASATWQHIHDLRMILRGIAIAWAFVGLFIGLPWWLIVAYSRRRAARST